MDSRFEMGMNLIAMTRVGPFMYAAQRSNSMCVGANQLRRYLGVYARVEQRNGRGARLIEICASSL